MYKQFDIILLSLDPIEGSEQGGTRPCVILQTNAMNPYTRTYIVAPLSSSQLDKIYASHVLVKKSENNKLEKDSKLKLDQIRVIDGQRIQEKWGILEEKYHIPIFLILENLFDKEGLFR